MNSVVLSTSQEIKGGEKLKKLKNNKGFSLVELLIVIAIMGVLAVIAFNMFGGVLTNSKKRADDQQAKNIEKAILTYCIDSNDWKLTGAKDEGGASISIVGISGHDLIQILMEPIFDAEGKEYGPYLSLKDPEKAITDDVNANAYDPQWNTDSGGDYTGWKIKTFPNKQSVKVEPTKDDDAIVSVATE